MMGDGSLGKFKTEYEKLHKALIKSHESEKRLMLQCQELNAELISNASKVTSALKISQDDKATISSQKQEIEKLWRAVDDAQDKESKAHDTIHQLKLENVNLNKFIENGAGLGPAMQERFDIHCINFASPCIQYEGSRKRKRGANNRER